MIRAAARPPLSPEAAKALADVQKRINSQPTYPDRVSEAAKLWEAKNRRLFDSIKDQLWLVAGPSKCCLYCETSTSPDVEHVQPKALYPDRAFQYDNYLMACNPCNTRKGSKAILELNGAIIVHQRGPKDPIVPPPAGTWWFLDPFSFDPMEYLFLDLIGGSFLYSPMFPQDPVKNLAAEETLRVLGLNERQELVSRRRNAFVAFRAMAKEYGEAATTARRKEIGDAIATFENRTVWAEMKRQRSFLPDVGRLFQAAPQLLLI